MARDLTGTPPQAASDGTESAFSQIGQGRIGGKAQGLVWAREVLRKAFDPHAFQEFHVDVPWFWVIATDWFDRFMEHNDLYDLALSDARDPHIASAFLKARLPSELVEELGSLVQKVRGPLALRSSSLLEDAIHEPFAGVYATKMVPNNQFSPEARLRSLLEGVRYVYASTFFQDAKSYRRALGRQDQDEKMAVMIQEVVGKRHGDRFYPSVSGVARSYNFYSLGHAQPENGVVSLALGLGKTIVDGGAVWTYCPAHPRAKPPYASTKELLTQTQIRFWSVNMDKPPSYDPLQETEYLLEGDLGHAEADGVLRLIASTYDAQSDRISLGTGVPGPRVLTFAPLLELDELPLNDLTRRLLRCCDDASGSPVEIEFAVNLPETSRGPAWFRLLQVRPMVVSQDTVEVREQEMRGDDVLVASEQVLGNGSSDSIRDVVYVKPEVFSAKDSWLVAAELDVMNRRLLEAGRPYLLVVLGRLGTSDPWLGIPVRWGQVSGAKVIVEATTPGMNVEMSQGSHFFHNVTCLRVLYFSVDKTGRHPLNWDRLTQASAVCESHFLRHVSFERPLHVKVDGRSRRGVILHAGADEVRH